MDLKHNHMLKSSKSSSRSDYPEQLASDQQFTMFSSQQPNSLGFSMVDSLDRSFFSSQRPTLQPHNQILNDSANQSCGVGIGNARAEFPFAEFQPCLESPSVQLCNLDDGIKNMDQADPGIRNFLQDCDPQVLLNSLVFLEQKIHYLQDIVKSIMYDRSLSGQSNELVAKQQLVIVDISSIIIQLMSIAGTLLPSGKNNHPNAMPSASDNPFLGQMDSSVFGSVTGSDRNNSQQSTNLATGGRNALEREANTTFGSSFNTQNLSVTGLVDGHIDGKFFEDVAMESKFGIEKKCKSPNIVSFEESQSIAVEDHIGDLKDDEEDGDAENLPVGSYEVLQLEEEEILAPHTHFCLICGKGFKRDANLRMHMRGHGDEYKTPAALARPARDLNPESTIVKRYSCPSVGCKRNKDHKKFQPLKTILCVKNHYKRSHCDKSYTCSKCNSKKFSVLADLKTHEKHCGRDKWLCSCGTTFSRKDKLFGHVALFQGHAPAIPLDEPKGPGTLERGEKGEAVRNRGSMGFKRKESFDHSYGPPINFYGRAVNETGDFSMDQINMPNISCLKEDRAKESTANRELSQLESRVAGGSSSFVSFLSSNFMQENRGSPSSNGLR